MSIDYFDYFFTIILKIINYKRGNLNEKQWM